MDFFDQTVLGLNVGPFCAENRVYGGKVVKVPRGTLGIVRKVGN